MKTLPLNEKVSRMEDFSKRELLERKALPKERASTAEDFSMAEFQEQKTLPRELPERKALLVELLKQKALRNKGFQSGRIFQVRIQSEKRFQEKAS